MILHPIDMSPATVLMMPKNCLEHKSDPGISPSQLNTQSHLVLGAVAGKDKELRCRSTAVFCPFLQGTRSPYTVEPVRIDSSMISS